ncbi:hypothetical protein BV25DRAFT_1815403 [Artomyces pyxidatus]|uniref:Uncharacterized protein n=1 Tax=Artomyces pyxidatus TaxID=48021 RepID=A0ACB8SI16_9AGAM|nr:hypothetical protein BV25DRAFT_1815403 [Artomyces pyxidatus]
MRLLLSILVILSTALSVHNSSYLDTSDPMVTQLPHPLRDTHYFASKSNSLNTVFLKRAWAWTSAALLFHIYTSPTCSYRARRVCQHLLATCCWLLVAQGIGGASLIDRFAIATGGQCTLHLPPPHIYILLPTLYCQQHIRVSISSHPHLFPTPLSFVVAADETWSSVPRIRKGHDISGHIFLLTLSVMVLFDQLNATIKRRWSLGHLLGTAGSAALVFIWLIAIWTTGVYFHLPSEKISGFCE